MIYPLSGLSKKAGYDPEFDEYERHMDLLRPNRFKGGPYEYRRFMWQQGKRFIESPTGQGLLQQFRQRRNTPSNSQPQSQPQQAAKTTPKNPLGGLPRNYGMAAGLITGLGGKYVKQPQQQTQQPSLWQKAVISPIKSLLTGPAYK